VRLPPAPANSGAIWGGRVKVIFIAGPYGDSQGYLAIEDNIVVARVMAATLVEAGYGFFCPHLNSAHFEVITPGVMSQFWLDMDRLIMRGCDALIALPGWASSAGSKAEIQIATKLGLPVFLSLRELRGYIWPPERED
jgi:hypothetical protein